MDIATALFLSIGALLASAMSRLVCEEAKAWCPWLSRYLLGLAIQRLPSSVRERFLEEWQSHLDSIPGDLGKIYVALGFNVAARRAFSVIDYRAAEIGAIVAAILRLEVKAVDLDEDLLDFGMDSLCMLELVMTVEHKLGLFVPREVLEAKPVTARRIAEALARRCPEQIHRS